MSFTLDTGIQMKIKNNLKVWRAKRDITQQQLADSVELSRQTINSIEKGKFIPSVYTALKLARYFNTTIEEIFSLNIENGKETGF
jgi:putative transcriptional regulator